MNLALFLYIDIALKVQFFSNLISNAIPIKFVLKSDVSSLDKLCNKNSETNEIILQPPDKN